MRSEEITGAIVTRLQGAIDASTAEIKEHPVQAEDYARAVKKPIIYVVLHGIKGKPESGSDYLRQEITYTVEVSIKARSLIGVGGVYDLNDEILFRLVGYTPLPGMKHLVLVQAQHNGTKEQVIDWSLFFKFDGFVTVADDDPEADYGANLTETILVEEIES